MGRNYQPLRESIVAKGEKRVAPFPLAFLDSFCKETGIAVDWNLNEATWRAAGRAFNCTLLAEENSETPARDEFLPTSSSELTHSTMGSGF